MIHGTLLGVVQVTTEKLPDNVCPVCGYDNLTHPPKDYMICPCCGTEFGYDDFTATHEELRQEWMSNGCQWFSSRVLAPTGWDPVAQLRTLELRILPQDAGTYRYCIAVNTEANENFSVTQLEIPVMEDWRAKNFWDARPASASEITSQTTGIEITWEKLKLAYA